MNTLHRKSSVVAWHPSIENLEERRLFSLMVGGGLTLVASPMPTPIQQPPTSAAILSGRQINAEAGQPFKAVIGSIAPLPLLSSGYVLHGSIDWGDGTADTSATFIRQAGGVTAMIGSHTYSADGSDKITITVTETPPTGTLPIVILLGTIHSTANVISSDGGVTLNESAGVPLTANVGTFSSDLSSLLMNAVIDWGDGTTSAGRILALPTAGPGASLVAGGRFAVFGDHTYAQTGSYLVQVTVTASPIVDPPGPTPDYVILVAQIDSVIDVLPVTPVAVTVSPIATTIFPVASNFIDTTGQIDAAQSLLY